MHFFRHFQVPKSWMSIVINFSFDS